MKHILTLFLLLLSISIQAQLESVIVETYYISDANDATDTLGGKLEEGSVTYRVYIDLTAGSQLKKIYGDANHLLKISSTAVFFNHASDGQTFAKEFNKIRLKENTVALDTWLTLGQATRTSSKTYFGVLKAEDTDGSFIGGANNDGGSAEIPDGLLINDDPAAGIPLTTADGLDTMIAVPSNWISNGILDPLSGEDSTIFGSAKKGSQFISNNAVLQNSGVMGRTPGNKIVIAQLTTKGEISFELNIEVLDTNGNTIKYVADGTTLLPDERLSSYLKYPFILKCGCPDASYVEYKADRDCDQQDSCKTLKVFGCTDPIACNYDPSATVLLPDFCCYPGSCQDRDISLVCPQLGISEQGAVFEFELYPNPAQDKLILRIPSARYMEGEYTIYDSFCKVVSGKNMAGANTVQRIDVSGLASGLYMFRVHMGDSYTTKLFIKN